jgi:MFS family permease
MQKNTDRCFYISLATGRLSDKFGRVPVLILGAVGSIASAFISYFYFHIEGLWWAMVPVSLLNQNMGVMKALFAVCVLACI